MNFLAKHSMQPQGAYSDEVLNANSLPQAILAAIGLPRSSPRSKQTDPSKVSDPETFLARLYRAQE